MLEKLKIGNLFGNSKPTSEPVQQDIVGIDISHSYVRTIGLKKKNKKWSLHKISTKILDERYDTDAKRDEDIVNLLKTIKLEQRFETDNAAISLPVNAAIVQVIQIPYLDDKGKGDTSEMEGISGRDNILKIGTSEMTSSAGTPGIKIKSWREITGNY